MNTQIRLAFYGDDFTGSTDALEFLTRAGLRTVLFLSPPAPAQLARFPDLQAVGVAGLTRSLAPDAMERELRPAFTALRSLGAPHVHYKVCSTFDSSPKIGSIGRAIDVGAAVFSSKFVPLLVGAPALGRHCVFGNLFARMGIGSDGEIHRLDRHPSMSKHPVTPADESDLRLHLAKQTKKTVALFDILKIELPEADAHTALETLLSTKPEIVLFDLLYANQLARVGSLIDAHAAPGQPLFSAGSSGIEMALGAHWAAQGKIRPVTDWPKLGNADPILVVSGSCSPVTSKQIAWALSHGFVEVELDTPALAAGKPADIVLAPIVATTVAHLQSGRNVILHANRGADDPRTAAVDAAFAARGFDAAKIAATTGSLFGSALGVVARCCAEQTTLRRVLFAGGDSSSYAARAIGVEAVEMIAPLAPGAPLCRAHSSNPAVQDLEVNFKGGQVGSEDYFGTVAASHV